VATAPKEAARPGWSDQIWLVQDRGLPYSTQVIGSVKLRGGAGRVSALCHFRCGRACS
jgi:hypothetical protein